MTLTAQQIEARKTGIGGSDIASICGLVPYKNAKTAVDVWMEKTGRFTAEFNASDNEPAYWGNVLEDVVADEYAKRNNCKIRRVDYTIRHPQHAFILGNIDRYVVRADDKDRIGDLLEVKTTGAHLADNWADDSVPVYYQAQCQWYMGVTGADLCDLAVLIGGNNYQQRRLERDDDTIATLIELGRKFWVDHVLTGIAPAPCNASDVLKLWPRDNGTSIEADAELIELLSAFQEARQRNADTELLLDQAATAVKNKIGAASAVTFSGQTLATWKQSKDKIITDWKAAFADLAEGFPTQETPTRVIAERTRTVPGARPFLLKTKG